MSAAPQIPDSLHHLKEQLGPAYNGISGSRKAQEEAPSSRFELHDIPVENFRPLKVVVIGAGYSGIYLGIRIPERLRNVQLTIYDKNAGIGGTWYVVR